VAHGLGDIVSLVVWKLCSLCETGVMSAILKSARSRSKLSLCAQFPCNKLFKVGTVAEFGGTFVVQW
jgi:hypothetical protein